MSRPTDIMLLFSIADRGRGILLLEELKKRGIKNHFQCTGVGTATSDMMDILGLGTSEKDVIISFGMRGQAERFVDEVSSSLEHVGRGRGLIMLIPLNAISALASAILQKQAGGAPMDRQIVDGNTSSPRSLIMIAVNAGFTDEVMTLARTVGATGGTVVRGRLAGVEELASQFGIELAAERELITILSAEETRDKILQAVNETYGLRSPAQGIICSVPVERAFKL